MALACKFAGTVGAVVSAALALDILIDVLINTHNTLKTRQNILP
jgi:hypothetical protein